ncbi:MAG: type I 3-dehydroquinate dehydratase, partial [Pyrinomonadaceae bacterium]
MNTGKICISLCSETASDLCEKVRRAEADADVIEIRFDCLNAGELNEAIIRLPKTTKTYLFTLRPREQGGSRDLTRIERLKLWEKILRTHRDSFFLADNELDIGHDLQIDPARIIVSHHD